MQIAHVVARVNDEASGPAYSVPRLCEELAAHGAAPSLHVLEPVEAGEYAFPVHAYRVWPMAGRLGISSDMKQSLGRLAADLDIVHNHGLWMMPNLYSFEAATRSGCVFVTSPEGMLSPWALARSGARKSLMLRGRQGDALNRAHCLFAASTQEMQDLRAFGSTQPIAVVPHGIDLRPARTDYGSGDGMRTLLYLGRIHEVKSVDVLVQAWSGIEGEFPNWQLRVAGPIDSRYARSVVSLAKSLGAERIEFLGAVFGAAKNDLFDTAELFVLPTRSENYGVAVAEALAAGLPAIVTRAAPWGELQTKDAGWWIDQGLDALVEALRLALACSKPDLVARGQRGRAWIGRDYAWDRISAMYLETYRWLIQGGEVPGWVHLE